jgi:hypothetical protein
MQLHQVTAKVRHRLWRMLRLLITFLRVSMRPRYLADRMLVEVMIGCGVVDFERSGDGILGNKGMT